MDQFGGIKSVTSSPLHHDLVTHRKPFAPDRIREEPERAYAYHQMRRDRKVSDRPRQAAITGDFVLTADEVNPVIKSLRDGGIAVTALHSHMLGEEPRLFFMHLWANDDAMELARALHRALGHMKIKAGGA